MAELNSLLSELTSGEETRAERAAMLLATHGAEALHALQGILRGPHTEARWWGTRALAEFPTSQAAPLLIQALDDPDLLVRQCAAHGLYLNPDERAIPALLDAMSGGDSLLSRLAANALAALGEPAIPVLVEALENGGSVVQLEAIRALALMGAPGAIPALFNALDEDSSLMAYWANEGLERMGIGMTFFKP